MTKHSSDNSAREDITTEKAFNEALTELMVAALQNGIDPRGGWVCRNGDTVPDSEVMIYELDDESE